MSVNCYEAEFEFRTGTSMSHVSTLRVQFTSMTKKASVVDAYRFWNGRNQNVPNFFHELLCMKVYTKRIGPIGNDGSATNGNGMQFFEWKVDFPGTIQEYMDEFASKVPA